MFSVSNCTPLALRPVRAVSVVREMWVSSETFERVRRRSASSTDRLGISMAHLLGIE